MVVTGTEKERNIVGETKKPQTSVPQKIDPNALVKLKLLLQGAPLGAQARDHSGIGMVRNSLNYSEECKNMGVKFVFKFSAYIVFITYVKLIILW